jgi:peptidoglycan hydrolase CwlO-like protein
MDEIVFDMMVEKQEKINKSIEALTTKTEIIPDYAQEWHQMHERQRMIQTDIKSIPQQISIPLNEITELKQEVLKLNAQLKEPLLQKIKRLHYLSKSLLACTIP